MCGTGTSTVIVAILTLFLGSKEAVILASLVNVLGGFAMLGVDKMRIPPQFLYPSIVAMMIGSGLGALALLHVPHRLFEFLLGLAFIIAAIWFWRYTPSSEGEMSGTEWPPSASPRDIMVSLFAGVCGGFVGINAAPLVIHFGSYLSKRLLRRFLVIIFLPAAIVQSASFSFFGLVTPDLLFYALLMLPGLALGIYAGNHFFLRLSEQRFRRFLAFIIFIIALKTLVLV